MCLPGDKKRLPSGPPGTPGPPSHGRHVKAFFEQNWLKNPTAGKVSPELFCFLKTLSLIFLKVNSYVWEQTLAQEGSFFLINFTVPSHKSLKKKAIFEYKMSHRNWEGHKKCHVLFEWPLRQWIEITAILVFCGFFFNLFQVRFWYSTEGGNKPSGRRKSWWRIEEASTNFYWHRCRVQRSG